jgi:biopolymer transport protein ExbD
MKLNLTFERKARIEMLPLIDIVFLLLVFFIYAMLSMAVHHGLPVNLPNSSTAKIDKKLVLAVTVSADGLIFLDKEPVNIENLTNILKIKARTHTDPGVLLFADKSVSFQKLFQVLDRINAAGLSRISLQAEPEKQ